MGQISCLIQSDGTAVGHESDLERRLQHHHAEYHPDDPLTVSWRHVAPELMFTGGAPSRTSVISCVIEGSTTRSGREQYMRGICDLWSDVTGCDDHDLLVSITEAG